MLALAAPGALVGIEPPSCHEQPTPGASSEKVLKLAGS